MSQSEMTCTKNNEKPYFDSGNEFLFQQWLLLLYFRQKTAIFIGPEEKTIENQLR